MVMASVWWGGRFSISWSPWFPWEPFSGRSASLTDGAERQEGHPHTEHGDEGIYSSGLGRLVSRNTGQRILARGPVRRSILWVLLVQHKPLPAPALKH